MLICVIERLVSYPLKALRVKREFKIAGHIAVKQVGAPSIPHLVGIFLQVGRTTVVSSGFDGINRCGSVNFEVRFRKIVPSFS